MNQCIEFKKSNYYDIYGNILYVGGDGPGNYSSIQDAIDNATNDDTIFVYNDSSPYFENIIIDKQVNLRGEDKNTTVIDGKNIGDVVYIFANFVNISGFTIKNSGDVYRDAGIKIQSKKNEIKGNILQNNDDGICILSTSYNTIIRNNVSNNDYGIRLFIGSSKNILIKNDINSNSFRGIRLENSNKNVISDNKICNNGNGVRFEDSDFNYFSDNKISNNGIGVSLISSISSTILNNSFVNDGFEIQDSYKNTISNNTINERPIVYLEEESDMIIDFAAGQILLVNCNNITIKYQYIYNVTSGILLWQTNNSLITDNLLYSNDFDGILLYSSSNNIIKENIISNSENGISLEYSSLNNKISENIIFENSYGIHLIYSSGEINISDNIISNNSYGIQLYDSQDIIVTNNYIFNNYFGISLWQLSSNNYVFENEILNCDIGIWLNYANDNRILKNTITGSKSDGVWLLESIHNKIDENTVIESRCSVELTNSNYNIITDNTFVKGGIISFYSFQNTVKDNIVNNKPLVYLENKADVFVEEAGQVILIDCEEITVQNNEFFDLIIGIELWDTNYCQIINNTLSGDYYGSWLIRSSNNTFSGNVISNYSEWGIYIGSSNDNNILENDIFIEDDFYKMISFKNKYLNFIVKNLKNPIFHHELLNEINTNKQAIILSNCNRNILSNNYVSNSDDGLILDSSCKNTIKRNVITSNKDCGILMMNSCDNNEILKNKITKNGEYGLYIEESSYNKIKKNNFIENNNSAFFKLSFLNRWVKNYWGTFRILPKPIFGKIKIGSNLILWINIDWRPSRIALQL